MDAQVKGINTELKEWIQSNPQVCAQLIFNKGAKVIQWKKELSTHHAGAIEKGEREGETGRQIDKDIQTDGQILA